MSCNGNCNTCGGCGGSCGGCAREMVLTREELDFLQELGQVAFLPVARKMGDLNPIYLEEGTEKRAYYGLLLQCLEKKGLITLDYDKPLTGFDDSAYMAYPIRGSMGLTLRGQRVLELLEYQGFSRDAE